MSCPQSRSCHSFLSDHALLAKVLLENVLIVVQSDSPHSLLSKCVLPFDRELNKRKIRFGHPKFAVRAQAM